MSGEIDEYDLFLETWKPSQLFEHATLDSNLFDPLAQERLLEDVEATGSVQRAANVERIKTIDNREQRLRQFGFFVRTQTAWADDFCQRLCESGITDDKVDSFIRAMATDWVDGKRRRQYSDLMLSIKASIQNHDRAKHRNFAGRYVINAVSDDVEPLFTEGEMACVFAVNRDMLEAYMASYLGEFDADIGCSINNVYVRRGVGMPNKPGELREELHYLSSYSLAVTPAEKFAQTSTFETNGQAVPCIFSAPLPAIQDRVVAFAPFIKGMDLDQLELVVAPPVLPMPLHECGTFGGVVEYEFG